MESAFSHILLACDDTAASRMALHYACELAESGATLAIVHASGESNFIASAAAAGGFPAIDPKPMIDAVNASSGDAILEAAVQACNALGITAHKVYAHGPPVDAVVTAGRQIHADAIVVGTHARTGLARAIHGSVAERILRTSDVPVLIVSGHAKAPAAGKPVFRRALVAIDESDPSTAALSIAARLAEACGTRLTLCNVDNSATANYCDDGAVNSGVTGAVTFFLERAAAVKDVAPFVDDEIVIEGDPSSAIEHAAMQRNCDVIIVGSHARTGLQRIWDGSVAETVARSSALPVFVVPLRHGAPRIEVEAADRARC